MECIFCGIIAIQLNCLFFNTYILYIDCIALLQVINNIPITTQLLVEPMVAIVFGGNSLDLLASPAPGTTLIPYTKTPGTVVHRGHKYSNTKTPGTVVHRGV